VIGEAFLVHALHTNELIRTGITDGRGKIGREKAKHSGFLSTEKMLKSFFPP
jgi:hypothetical protein